MKKEIFHIEKSDSSAVTSGTSGAGNATETASTSSATATAPAPASGQASAPKKTEKKQPVQQQEVMMK